MEAKFIAILATLAGLFGLLIAEKQDSTVGKWLTKPVASAAFISVAVFSGALDHTYGTIIVAGLVLSWFGDVLLIPKAKAPFMAGLVSFLLGHVAYCVAFATRGFILTWTTVALPVTALATFLVMRGILPHVEKKMQPPVVVYGVVITVMVAFSAGTAALASNVLIFVGATMFYVSDISVARDRFVKESFLNRIWGLPLYYGGQLLLAYTSGV